MIIGRAFSLKVILHESLGNSFVNPGKDVKEKYFDHLVT